MSKFYKLQWKDSTEGWLCSWATTKKDANTRRRAVLNDYKNRPKEYSEPVSITEVEIPNDKAGLAGWLDRNHNRELSRTGLWS